MHKVQPPLELEATFTKPGADWRPDEKQRLISWLWEDSQYRYLLSVVLRIRKASAEDAEDAWSDFYVTGRLQKVIESYDPSFWIYLLSHFKKFCYERRKQKTNHQEHEEPLPKPRQKDEGERIDIKIPHEIEAIFNKPGSTWMAEEEQKVRPWLLEKGQRDYLHRFSLRYLWHQATAAEAEEVLDDFFKKRLHKVVESHDPDFWVYLLLCYKRFLGGRPSPPSTVRITEPETEGGDRMDRLLDAIQETNAVEESNDPEEILHREQQRARLRTGLRKALQRLARSHPLYHRIIVDFYFRDMSRKEIAETLNMTEGNVGVKLHLARQVLKKYLSQEGSDNERTPDPRDQRSTG